MLAYILAVAESLVHIGLCNEIYMFQDFLFHFRRLFYNSIWGLGVGFFFLEGDELVCLIRYF